MELENCIELLRRRKIVVEPEDDPGRWLVFQVNNPYEVENGGWPDYYDEKGLIELVEHFLINLPNGDCPYHPFLVPCDDADLDSQGRTTEREGMNHAYDGSDPTKTVLSTAEWAARRSTGTPMCPVCHQQMHCYGKFSVGTNARFDHNNGLRCIHPAPQTPFHGLNTAPRDPALADSAKAFALAHLNLIYEACRRMCPGLLWNEFLPLLTEAKKHRIWELKEFDPRLLPYVLLCGASTFPKTKYRAMSIYFALEPNTQAPGYWNGHGAPKKRFLWRMTNGQVELIEMTMDALEPNYLKKARLILG